MIRTFWWHWSSYAGACALCNRSSSTASPSATSRLSTSSLWRTARGSTGVHTWLRRTLSGLALAPFDYKQNSPSKLVLFINFAVIISGTVYW